MLLAHSFRDLCFIVINLQLQPSIINMTSPSPNDSAFFRRKRLSELLRSSGGGTEASSLLVSTPPVPVSLASGNRLQGEFSRDCLCLCLPGGLLGPCLPAHVLALIETKMMEGIGTRFNRENVLARWEAFWLVARDGNACLCFWLPGVLVGTHAYHHIS